jgi:hypothetical protein
MPKWRNEYRRCDNCRIEYRAQREAQSYCSPDCRRTAAYGRERFRAGAKGRRIEASDSEPGTLVAGSFRNDHFSSIKSVTWRPTDWIAKLSQAAANEIDRAYWTREKRKWPVDLIGGARHSARRPTLTIDSKLRQTIRNTERIVKDDELTGQSLVGHEFQLEYHADGYPKLPTCLDRWVVPDLAQAA